MDTLLGGEPGGRVAIPALLLGFLMENGLSRGPGELAIGKGANVSSFQGGIELQSYLDTLLESLEES